MTTTTDEPLPLPTLAPTTVAEIKVRLGIPDATDDADLAVIVAALDRFVRRLPVADTARGRTGTAQATGDTITVTRHGLKNDDKIVFETAPAGVPAGVAVFVRDALRDTFKVAAAAGGVALDVTADATTVVYATEAWPPDIALGAAMLGGRLLRRKNSPEGVASFSDLGPVYVQRNDPDVAMLLQLGDWAAPAVG